jgi:hypothetical protein
MVKIILFFVLIYNTPTYAQVKDYHIKDSSIRIKRKFIQADLLLPGYANISNTFFARKSQILNASFCYLINHTSRIKKFIQLNVYLYDEKNTDISKISFGKVNTRKNSVFITPEVKILFNKKTFNKGFYFTFGIGGGVHKYFENSKIITNDNAWNSTFSIGYLLAIKNLYFDFKIGAGSYFTYKSYHNFEYTGTLTSKEYLDIINKSEPNLNVSDINIINSSTVIYSYKYAGIMNPVFIPNFGIHIGYMF